MYNDCKDRLKKNLRLSQTKQKDYHFINLYEFLYKEE